jgi:tRNA G18 (ribose-2'-O)-methylase SpoU
VRRWWPGHGHDRRAAELTRPVEPVPITAPTPVPITDPGDPRLADYTGLRHPDRRQRYEADHRVLVAEGTITIRALLRSAYPVRSLLVTPQQWDALAPDVVRAGCAAPVFVADRDVMAEVAGFDIHRGAVAAAGRLPAADPAGILPPTRQPAIVAAVEGVNDHENLGALFRNAAAFGVAAVVLDPTTADPLYRRAVRVSLGHVLHVPFARLSPWPDRLELLRTAGFEIVALTPVPGAEPIDDIATRLGDRVAFVLGAEGPGLSDAALAAADRRLRIPMAPGVDSLNVATAAAVAFHVVAAARRAQTSR